MQVRIHPPVPAEAAWRALVDPAVAGRWFGTLSAPLRAGARACLDFGDGDFFDLHVLEAVPPHRLRYEWRFLGIGPLDTISWEIRPENGGSRVTVTDGEEGRSREAALALREGWLDFTGRLERFLATGEEARYDWRRELDGSIELALEPARAWDRLFAPGVPSRWLPLDGFALEAGMDLVLEDGGEPSSFRIDQVLWIDPAGVRFLVSHPRWRRPTHCQLELLSRGSGSLLIFSHVGWEGIDPDPRVQYEQRRRFCGAWIETLKRARERVG